MKKLTLLLFILSGFAVCAQDVELLHRYDSSRTTLHDELLYIEAPINLNMVTHVALIQVSSRAGLESLYTFCRSQASELGANCYRITEFEHQGNGLRIILDLYYANEPAKKNIREHQPQNVVHVFGSDEPAKTYSCKINNQKVALPPFMFYQQEIRRGEEIKVSKGGITGMAVWVTWAEHKPARYIGLSGFGLNGVGVGPGVGASFNTGRLTYLEPELGRFLSVVMRSVND